MADSDRIEKEIVVRAPRSRVWRALTSSREFGEWFRCQFDDEFAVGKVMRGRITHAGFEHVTMEITIERMDAEELFSFRWHPYALDPKVDYSSEPPTLIEFRLRDAEGGTHLRVVESGFDGIPEWRRSEAFRMNEHGWTAQMENIRTHVER